MSVCVLFLFLEKFYSTPFHMAALVSFLGGFLVTHQCSSNAEKKNKRKYNEEEVRVAVVCVKKRLLSGSGNNNLLVKLF